MRDTLRLSSAAAVLLVAIVMLPHAAFAAEVVAEVVESAGNTIQLTKVNTPSLSFQVNEGDMTIPVSQIQEIKAFGKAGLFQVTFVSGETIEGSPTSSISGEWELGSYTLQLSKAKSVTFEMGKGRGTSVPVWKQPVGFVAVVNGMKVYGLEYEFTYTYHYTSRFTFEFKSEDNTVGYFRLPIVKGPALYFVPFSKMKQAAPGEAVMTDGTKVAATFSEKDRGLFEGHDRKLIGQTPFGYIEFSLEKVRTITFLHDKDLQIGSVLAGPKKSDQKFETDSKIQAVITLANGDTVGINGLEVISGEGEQKGYAYSKSTDIDMYIGEGLNSVDLSKLSGIRELTVKHESSGESALLGSIITKAGKTLAVQFEKSDICFGGPCALGYVKVCTGALKEIQIK